MKWFWHFLLGLGLVLSVGPVAVCADPPAEIQVELGDNFVEQGIHNLPQTSVLSSAVRVSTGGEGVEFVQYRFNLKTLALPDHLLMKLTFQGGNYPAVVSLLDAKGLILQDNLFGDVAESPGQYETVALHVPLVSVPDVATIAMNVIAERDADFVRAAFVPMEGTTVIRSGATSERDGQAPKIVDTKNAQLITETRVATTDGSYAAQMSGPLLEEGRAYGVETRLYDESEVKMLDQSGRFLGFSFSVDSVPLILRVDLKIKGFPAAQPFHAWLKRSTLSANL